MNAGNSLFFAGQIKDHNYIRARLLILPIFMRQRFAVEFIADQLPLGQKVIHQGAEAVRVVALEDCSMTPRIKTGNMVISSLRPVNLDSARSTRSVWRKLRAAGAKACV